MALRQGVIGGKPVWGKVLFFGQKIDCPQHRAVLHYRNIDARAKPKRCDQRMVKEIAGEFGRGIGDKGLLARDAMVIPAVWFPTLDIRPDAS